MFTVLVLTYGDHLALVQRCLGSILQYREPLVTGIRVGANAISRATRDWLWELHEQGILEQLEIACTNRCKYPMMRTLLFDRAAPVATPYVVWFDDDSYIRPAMPPGFFTRLAQRMETHDMVGDARWRFPHLVGNQAGWIRSRAWYTGKPLEGRSIQFATGGWWCVRTALLRGYNWPDPEILHRGGDVMLGELCHQQGLRLGLAPDLEHLAINADLQGTAHKSPRRGFDSQPVGWDYPESA